MAVQTLRELLVRAADTYGEGDAFRYKEKKNIVTRSYLDLKRDSEAFSRMLAKKGMEGTHVAIVGSTSYLWVVSYFGAVNGGNVAVPLDASLPKEALCRLLERAEVSVFVYDAGKKETAELAKEKCPSIKEFIAMEELPRILEEHGSVK